MKNNLELVREAVIKANPEIMELKFGCEVGHWRKQLTVCGFNEGTGKSRLIFRYPDDDCVSVSHKDFLESGGKILGRPIRLSDVLFAIWTRTKGAFVVYADGGFFINHSLTNDMKSCGVKWNLKKDSLDNQSPECIDFLKGVLCK